MLAFFKLKKHEEIIRFGFKEVPVEEISKEILKLSSTKVSENGDIPTRIV